MSRDWYLFVDDNDGEGQRPANAEEIREFLQCAEWFKTPTKEGVTMTTSADTRGGHDASQV